MNSSAKLVLKIPVFSPYRSELQSLHLRYPTHFAIEPAKWMGHGVWRGLKQLNF